MTKKWVGPVGGDVVVKLFANGKDTAISLTLQANQNWEGKFTNLPTYDDKGIEIKYQREFHRRFCYYQYKQGKNQYPCEKSMEWT
ncbi:Cna B-type domain-containing protein [Carnobacterium maltaromaticum]|uniref:Cna B-type domain-containing protein n=1 Tax=Carnobacterium maltaromaticum TaxID=2751 RepID=UPI00026C8440|nr:Cna B-type domain-containing protein [Carnobacterium maltaromaticum]